MNRCLSDNSAEDGKTEVRCHVEIDGTADVVIDGKVAGTDSIQYAKFLIPISTERIRISLFRCLLTSCLYTDTAFGFEKGLISSWRRSTNMLFEPVTEIPHWNANDLR